MDYPKRNNLRSEIDILIERLGILQEQEKSYKDLSVKINNKSNKLKELQKQEKELENNIKTLDLKEVKLKEDIVSLTGKKVLLIKDKEHLTKRTEQLNDGFRKQEQNLINLKEKLAGEEEEMIIESHAKISIMVFDINEHENKKNKLDWENRDLRERVNKQKLVIEKEGKRYNQIIKNKETLETDYKELDGEYQKLLEDYIIK